MKPDYFLERITPIGSFPEHRTLFRFSFLAFERVAPHEYILGARDA